LSQDVPVNIKAHNNPLEVNEKAEGDYRIYSWIQNDLAHMNFEDNAPDWYFPRPYYEFSSYETWDEVGEYFAQKYQPNYRKGGAVSDIVNKIKNQSSDSKIQARLALDYIHDNIRYTGIEMGSGGYLPRLPEKTLRQKFGDCKDMAILLVAILRELNITADSVWVDSDYNSKVDLFIPSHAIFDHVIVRAEIEGEIFLLDGTRGKQLGDLDHMEQGRYGKGLLLEKRSPLTINMLRTVLIYFQILRISFWKVPQLTMAMKLTV